MTSMPASRSAAATTFAPRSCPSKPGFATSTLIGRTAVDRRGLDADFVTSRCPGTGGRCHRILWLQEGVHQIMDGWSGTARAARFCALCQENSFHARGLGAYNIDLIEVPHVQRLLRHNTKCVQRRLEDCWIGLFYADQGGVEHNVEILSQSCCTE